VVSAHSALYSRSGDPVANGLGQCLVLQQHQMHIEQRIQLAGRILGHFFLKPAQLVNHRIACRAGTLDLRLHLIGPDEVMHHLHATGGHNDRAPDGNPSGDGQAVDGKCHSECPFANFAIAFCLLLLLFLQQSAPTIAALQHQKRFTSLTARPCLLSKS
jgi:hypothetical protein